MKYIKLFEEKFSESSGSFWEIRTDEPYFILSLKKIGYPQQKLDLLVDFLDTLQDYSWVKGVKKYYVGDDKQMGRWYFGSRKTMMEHNLMFMGPIKIPQYEIDALKYNL